MMQNPSPILNQEANESNKTVRTRQRVKENSRLLPQFAIDIMHNWYLNNYSNPYPSFRDCEHLAQCGNITVNQVKQWFVNIRRRTHNEFRKRRALKSNNKENQNVSIEYDPIINNKTDQLTSNNNILNYQPYNPYMEYNASSAYSNTSNLSISSTTNNSSGYVSHYQSPSVSYSVQSTLHSTPNNSSSKPNNQVDSTYNYWNDSMYHHNYYNYDSFYSYQY